MNLMARGERTKRVQCSEFCFWIFVLILFCIESILNSKCKAHISCFHFDIFLPSFLPSFLILKQHDSKGKSSSNSQHLTTSSNGSNAQRGNEASSTKKKSKKKKKKKKKDAASEDLWAQWLTHYFGFNDGMTIAQLRVSKSWMLSLCA